MNGRRYSTVMKALVDVLILKKLNKLESKQTNKKKTI